ncbi:MAG: glycoside hydrolase family 43 protein [Luteolibacter sp.]
MKKLSILWFSLMIGIAGASEIGGYLFVTFRNERSALAEQVYFGLSKNGSQWEALNDGKPVLVSDLGEKGARDPNIIRAQNGKFYIIATDLSIFHNRSWTRAVEEGSRSILIWESTDLVKWSEPRLVTVAPPDAGCTWAPEVIYDTASQRYLVYWASTSKADNFTKQRIYGAWTTDFKTFSPPFVYIEKPTTIIDTSIVQGDDGKYYRFTKDEKFKAITMEVSDSVTGTWKEIPDFSLAQLKGYEGPTCFQLKPAENGKPATWCLMLDAYQKRGGYHPFVTDNLASGNFTAGEGFSFPFLFRHGSVLSLSTAEYDRLHQALGKK